VALGQEEIGRRIQQAREDASLTQNELAGLIGLADGQSISRYERGETEVRTKRIRRIAEVTGKPMSFFIMENQPEPRSVSPTTIPYLEQVIERILAGGPAKILESQEFLEGMLQELRRVAETTLVFVDRVEALIAAARREAG